MEKIRVLVADNHGFFRKTIKRFLEETGMVEVIAEAENGEKAVKFSLSFHPQVVVMDIKMPILDGIKACKLIKRKAPHIKVILYSMYGEDIYNVDLPGMADRFIAKQKIFEEMINAIKEVCPRIL